MVSPGKLPPHLIDLNLWEFIQTRGMPNSPPQMILDMLDWKQIWGSGRPRMYSNSVETALWTFLPGEAEHCLVGKWLMGAFA
ncbi:hypothetical protein TNCV_1297131 [Trichonephila clavipes]|nr:hypothetical protein TNCV_1297131 [Trichonephila clavipes]